MTQRYFIAPPVAAAEVELTGDEAHHLQRVMRVPAGSEVCLFDGSGAEFKAKIAGFRKTSVSLVIEERIEVDREIGFALMVGVALPKGDRQKVLIEKLVEIGVTQFVPLITERGVAQPVESALARLERQVIEAAKQCGRNRLMQISPPKRWPDFARSTSSSIRWLADPRATAWPSIERSSYEQLCQPVSPGIAIAIGPEGGWTEAELAEETAPGWQRVSVGSRILRVETAALVLATVAIAAVESYRRLGGS